MRNISKKTRKKINKILLSNHFKKKLGVTQDTLVYTPNPESPLSAIWHHIEVLARCPRCGKDTFISEVNADE